MFSRENFKSLNTLLQTSWCSSSVLFDLAFKKAACPFWEKKKESLKHTHAVPNTLFILWCISEDDTSDCRHTHEKAVVPTTYCMHCEKKKEEESFKKT